MHFQDSPTRRPRQGWAEAFEEMARLGDDDLLDDEVTEEWLKPGEELEEDPEAMPERPAALPPEADLPRPL